MKRTIFFTALLVSFGLHAHEFDMHFADATLRLDYVFCGDATHSAIYFHEALKCDGWAGRKHNLSEPALRGNGQIRVVDPSSGETLYVNSFSSLFQEWQSTEEAKTLQKAFQNSFLVPFPKHPVDIEVTLLDNHARQSCILRHRIDPNDILIRKMSPTESKMLLDSGPGAIDIVIVSEGYSSMEKSKFYDDALRASQALFSHQPFNSVKDKFNVRAVFEPSEDSGISMPGKGEWKSTAVHSHFDTFYSSRYLTTSSMWELYDVIGSTPCEHVIVLANTSTYGGGGIFNSITLVASDHPTFARVLVHEFGHAFGGLADEYAYDEMAEIVYPSDTEPWEPNITTKVDFASKWEDMLGGTVDMYEGGGNQRQGVWRPVPDCRMRTNTYPDFCPVCTRAILRIVNYSVESIY